MEMSRRDQGIKEALRVLNSQGGRPNMDSVVALVDALQSGEAPKTYGERMVQMGLQTKGLI